MGGNIEDAEIIPLDTSHAYGVLGNDEKYVHFHDPRMQGKIIYVEKDSFNEDNHSSLESAYLKRNAKKP
jgi:predicted double-glycine peptidase